MTCVIVGKVKEHRGLNLTILDNNTGETHLVKPANGEVYDLPDGIEGVFIGEWFNDILTVNRYEPKKFLDPMYEEDLIGFSDSIIIELKNNPFEEIYRIKEAQMLLERDLGGLIEEAEEVEESRDDQDDWDNETGEYAN